MAHTILGIKNPTDLSKNGLALMVEIVPMSEKNSHFDETHMRK